jgi:hypothetical protein
VRATATRSGASVGRAYKLVKGLSRVNPADAEALARVTRGGAATQADTARVRKILRTLTDHETAAVLGGAQREILPGKPSAASPDVPGAAPPRSEPAPGVQPDGPALEEVRRSPAEATRHPDGQITAHGGSVVYRPMDDLGRATGVEGTLSPEMLNTGTPANKSLKPPGWKGHGTKYNQARGHLLARVLGGSGDLPENLVTLEQRWTNSPVMRDFELTVADALVFRTA